MLSDFLFLVFVLISSTVLIRYKLFVHALKTYHNPKQSLYSDLPGLFCPAWITRGAHCSSNLAFSVVRSNTRLYSSLDVLFQLSLNYGIIFLIML